MSVVTSNAASWVCGALLSLPLLGACSSCDEAETNPTESTETPTPTTGPALLAEQGTLQPGQRSADFEVAVNAGDHLTVRVESTGFDPVLAVQPPGAAVFTNDDWHGSRTESRIHTTAAVAGTLKITVTSFDPAATGAFSVTVHGSGGTAAEPNTRPAQTLAVGQSEEGSLAPGDVALSDGRLSDHFVVQGVVGSPLELLIEATGEQIPNAIVMTPSGQSLNASENGRYAIAQPGPHRVQLVSATPGQQAGYRISLHASSGGVTPTLARAHHQLPSAAGTQALTVGQTVQAQLQPGTGTLPSGEPAVVYQLAGQQGQPLHLEMTSSAFDTYLMVVSPSGQHWENDDLSGTNSGLDIVLPESGSYRVVATAYRADQGGTFELKSSAGRTAPAVPNAPGAGTPSAPPAANAAAANVQQGTLAAGDATLDSGEFVDVFPVQLQVNERVRFEANSSAFDTYLIVRPPSGNQTDNDDFAPPDTNAAIDYVAQVAGTHQVSVTSYQPGESGAYEFVTRRGGGSAAPPAGAPPSTPPANTGATAATGDQIAGRLQAGDGTLQSGEFRDAYTRSFTTGQPVQIRLDSNDFDPYLIVRSPSGHQSDNDDFGGTRNAGVDIPAAEAGTYQVLVTSYQPGEQGAYTLRFGAGAAVPQANPGVVPGAPAAPGGPAAPAGGGARVFGLFAGITDYPPGVGDLPECANDAIKLAEALRNHGLLDESRQVLLTDAQATRANVLSALQRFSQQMGPNDVFVFFYSGHGGQTQGSSDPREIDGTDEFLVLHDGQLMDDELANAFDSVQAGTSVVALDSCYSGGFAKDLITRPGRVGLFSSEEDVLSAVASQFQAGGYLSHFLRTAVAGEADRAPRDRVLTVGELTHFLYTQFGTHATDVELQGAYQHLVVDRGAVRVDQVLWAY